MKKAYNNHNGACLNKKPFPYMMIIVLFTFLFLFVSFAINTQQIMAKEESDNTENEELENSSFEDGELHKNEQDSDSLKNEKPDNGEIESDNLEDEKSDTEDLDNEIPAEEESDSDELDNEIPEEEESNSDELDNEIPAEEESDSDELDNDNPEDSEINGEENDIDYPEDEENDGDGSRDKESDSGENESENSENEQLNCEELDSNSSEYKEIDCEDSDSHNPEEEESNSENSENEELKCEDSDSDNSEEEDLKCEELNNDSSENNNDSTNKDSKEKENKAVTTATKNKGLKNGDNNKQVTKLKQDLTLLGFGNFPYSPSKKYGSVTKKVVKDFQKAYGISTTGNADNKTLNKIKQIIQSGYKDGQKGKHVKNLKTDLTSLGFGNFPKNPSEVYGKVTTNVVKDFQRFFELKADGIITKDHLNLINDVSYKKQPSDGKHVVGLKKNLTKSGFGNFPKNPSQVYGKVTKNVIKDFQGFFNLKQDGILSKDSLRLINDISHNRQPSNGKHIVGLKKNLTKSGFGNFPKNPSQVYGKVTKNVVKDFQSYFNIAKNGNLNKKTIINLKNTINSSYQSGKKSNKIRDFKIKLTKLGYGNFPTNPSTVYGSVTERVVKDFQKDNKLVSNGIGDSVTLSKLNQLADSTQAKKVVYLDAGHGGKDPGATGYGLREKDITLDLAKRVQKQLQSNGYHVIMTRTTDKFVELKDRTEKANKAKSDIFVSIHVNSAGGTGIETWMMSNASKGEQSRKLANNIQNEVINNTKEADRGVKDGNLHVNRESLMASALVEVGFIDRKEDAEKLKLNSFKNKVTKGIVNGIKNYFKVA